MSEQERLGLNLKFIFIISLIFIFFIEAASLELTRRMSPVDVEQTLGFCKFFVLILFTSQQ
jgi:hypothetical protein